MAVIENDKPDDHISATIHFNVYKQGDDIEACTIVREDGTIDVKGTLQNYMALLQSCIDHAQDICDQIPDDNDMTIYGSTHHVSIFGPENIINSLVEDELVYINDLEDDDIEEIDSDAENSDKESNEDDDATHHTFIVESEETDEEIKKN